MAEHAISPHLSSCGGKLFKHMSKKLHAKSKNNAPGAMIACRCYAGWSRITPLCNPRDPVRRSRALCAGPELGCFCHGMLRNSHHSDAKI